jgi:dimethylargininase
MLALTHLPSKKLQSCQRTFLPPVDIDCERALMQHATYCDALRACRTKVVTLDVNPDAPDGTFIEDTAIVLDEVAVLCSMGTASRRAEPRAMEPLLREHREVIRIDPPATIEGGDVLRVGRTLFVGTSCRTNAAGVALFAAIGAQFGYRVVPVPVRNCLHLKTACTALPDGRLLINRDWVSPASLSGCEWIEVPKDEPWAANVCLVNSQLLMAVEHHRTTELVDGLGFRVRSVDVSEFAKAEGGVTCLNLLIS